ncbi:hypothetical protein Trydic_g10222 [Trypoxylus dichotomus]
MGAARSCFYIGSAEYSPSKVMLCIWSDQVGVIYYELLKPNETITGERYGLELMRLSRALRENRKQHEQRHEKVILQHDNARPHVAKPVKTYLGSPTSPAIFHRYCAVRLSLVPFDGTWSG